MPRYEYTMTVQSPKNKVEYKIIDILNPASICLIFRVSYLLLLIINKLFLSIPIHFWESIKHEFDFLWDSRHFRFILQVTL